MVDSNSALFDYYFITKWAICEFPLQGEKWLLEKKRYEYLKAHDNIKSGVKLSFVLSRGHLNNGMQ